jgi:hypothetical protein
MKTHVNNSHWAHVTVAAAFIHLAIPAWAADTGHFVGGLMNNRDYAVPEPGFYTAFYNYFYTTDRYNDQNGNQVNSITINPGPGPGVALNMDFNADMYVFAPSFVWVSPWRILGAKYAAAIAPSFANLSLENAVYNSVGLGASGSGSNFAPGDLFVEPILLGWSLPHWDVSAGYGFYAPVGKYHTETVAFPTGSVAIPSSDNIGLGYWSQQFQSSLTWYPMTNRATAFTIAMTYLYNRPQEGTEVEYGQNFWLNWGISQYLPLKKDNSLLLEVGPAGYYEWQISDTTGSLVQSPSSRTTVGAIGGQIGLTYVPWMLVLNFRGMYEYTSEERSQGSSFSINLAKKF